MRYEAVYYEAIVLTKHYESQVRAPSAEVQARQKSELCKRNAPQW